MANQIQILKTGKIKGVEYEIYKVDSREIIEKPFEYCEEVEKSIYMCWMAYPYSYKIYIFTLKNKEAYVLEYERSMSIDE